MTGGSVSLAIVIVARIGVDALAPPPAIGAETWNVAVPVTLPAT